MSQQQQTPSPQTNNNSPQTRNIFKSLFPTAQRHTLSTKQHQSQYKGEGRSVSPFTKSFLIQMYKEGQQLQIQQQKIRKLETDKDFYQQKIKQQSKTYTALKKASDDNEKMYLQMIEKKQQFFKKQLDKIQTQNSRQMMILMKQRQSEAQVFSNQIAQKDEYINRLEQQNNKFREDINHKMNIHSDLTTAIEKLEIQCDALKQMYQKMQAEKNLRIQGLKQDNTKVKQQLNDDRQNHSRQLQSLTNLKDGQIRALQNKLQYEVRRLEQLRMMQNNQKDDQIAELKRVSELERINFNHVLEAERIKYDHLIQTEDLRNQKNMDEHQKKKSQLIFNKQNAIDSLSRDVQEMKRSLTEAHNENDKLILIINDLKVQNKSLEFQIKQCDQLFGKQKNDYVNMIHELREQIRLNQVNYVRQKDRNEAMAGQQLRLQYAIQDKQLLLKQINDLRHLLLQSSQQIQICREKFIFFEKQNKKIRYQLDRTTADNNSLLHLRRELQEQAIKWRQNYLRLAH